MLMLTNLVGFGSSGSSEQVVLDYRTAGGSGTDLTTYSFTGVDIGTPTASRYVIVALVGLNVTSARTISSVTIGGVSATSLMAGGVTGGGAFQDFAFYIAAVPTGTTGTIAVTWSGGQLRCGYAVWAATGVQSTTAVDSTSGAVSVGTATSRNVNTSLGGAVLGCSSTNVSGTATWTGITEQADSVAYDSTDTTTLLSAAHSDGVAAETPRSVTVAITAGDPRTSWVVSIR